MVFVCPTCNVQTSGAAGKRKPKAVSKSGKGWREKAKQRSIMPTQSELGYTCTCCKEMRSLEQYNPFKKKMASLFQSGNNKPTKPSKIKPYQKTTIEAPEYTKKSVKYLAVTAGFTMESLASSDYRCFDGTDVTVSWDDDIEMRRHAMKVILQKAVNERVIKIQCMVRIRQAVAKVNARRRLKRYS